MRVKFTIMTLTALLIASTSIAMTYAEPYGGNLSPKVYTQIKEAAEARQDELLYLLDKDFSEEVLNSILEASHYMKQAEETEDPQESLQFYMKALQLFRETWRMYLEDMENSANTFTTMTDEEPLQDPEDLEDQIKENAEKRLIKFQERIMEQYSSYYEEIEEMMEFLPEDSDKIQMTIENLQKKLELLKEKLENGELDDLIHSLEDDLSSFNEDLDYLNDKNSSKTIRMNGIDEETTANNGDNAPNDKDEETNDGAEGNSENQNNSSDKEEDKDERQERLNKTKEKFDEIKKNLENNKDE